MTATVTTTMVAQKIRTAAISLFTLPSFRRPSSNDAAAPIAEDRARKCEVAHTSGPFVQKKRLTELCSKRDATGGSARREAHDSPVFAKQHWARQYDKSVSALAGHRGKCAGEFVGGNRRYEVKLQSQGLGGSLDLLQYPRHCAFAVGTGMPERCHTRNSRNHVSQ